LENGIKNRIIGYSTKPASQFVANPRNPRNHPEAQRRAVAGLLEQVGWVGVVAENVNTGNLVDGHERIWQALDRGDDEPVPFIQLDLTQEEEDLILLTLDYTGELATYDTPVMNDLAEGLNIDELNAKVQEMLSDMSDKFKLDDLRIETPELEPEAESGKKKTTCPNCGWEF